MDGVATYPVVSRSGTSSYSGNRITGITGTPARTYTYDTDGSTVSYSNTTLTYNDRYRLATATVSSVATNYIYNALGQRIEKNGGPAGTVIFVYDEAGHLEGEYTSSGVLIQETVWLGDTPVATLQPVTGGVGIFYIHADHLNAPHMITRAADNGVMWRWDNDPYGSLAPNQNPAGLGAFSYNLRFPGQYYDVETGLFYNYFRDYDPQTGRYAETDPIGLAGGGYSTFAYARGNPVSFSDPSGLVTACELQAAMKIINQFGTGPQVTLSDLQTDPTLMNAYAYTPYGGPIYFNTNPADPNSYAGSVVANGQAANFVGTALHEDVHLGQPFFTFQLDKLKEHLTGGNWSSAQDQADAIIMGGHNVLGAFNSAVKQCNCQQ